jgi:hypothetical protein
MTIASSDEKRRVAAIASRTWGIRQDHEGRRQADPFEAVPVSKKLRRLQAVSSAP